MSAKVEPVSKKAKTASIDSLGRGLDILEILAQRDSVKLAEFPELLDTSRATAFRALKTLQNRGYVAHLRAERAYGLGAATIILAARSRTSSLIKASESAMRDIADRTRETVNLALFQGGRLTYVEMIEGSHALRMSGEIGQDVPLHSTALGMATLAELPEKRRRELLGDEPYRSFTPHTLAGWSELSKELERVTERGYAFDLEGMDEGAICVGAVIRGPTGEPLGGISASGFAARLDKHEREKLGELIRDWCQRIEIQTSTFAEERRANDGSR